MRSRFVQWVALLTVFRGAYLFAVYGVREIPDFGLYSGHGLGFYPSPLGRLVGSLGRQPFADVSSIAGGACVLLVAELAQRNGRSPRLAALLVFLLPIAIYTSVAGADAPAAALLLGALLVTGPWAIGLAAAAALYHLALVPFLPFVLRWSRGAIAVLIVVGLCSLAALLMTPYSGVVTRLSVGGARWGLLGLVLASFLAVPALLCGGLDRRGALAFLIGSAECGVEHHVQLRYFLPAVLFVCARSTTRPDWATRLVYRARRARGVPIREAV